jgi:serralysin
VAPHSRNADFLEYFTQGADKVYLDRTFYGGIANTGPLDADAFHVGNAAADAEDRIIYQASNRQLFYDADGTGPEVAKLFATLRYGLTIGVGDFVVYDG